MFGTKPSVAVLFDRSPPNRAQPASPDFEAARRLVQQGKYDEAVAALRLITEKTVSILARSPYSFRGKARCIW
jgi:hypothetical protein